MTGRNAYDKYTDASAEKDRCYVAGVGYRTAQQLLAWPFLTNQERNVWNDFARRITPKRRK